MTTPPGPQPALNIPAPVAGLIGLLALAHVGRAFVSDAASGELIVRFALIPARYSQEYLAAHNMSAGTLWDQIVPFFSYMALHGDFTHLGINLLWLLAFGPVVARRFGTLRFLLFFVICGLAGAGAHLLTNWGSENPVLGASAAISGLMAAGIRMLPMGAPFDRTPANDTPLAPLWGRQTLLFSATWIATNLAFGLTGFGSGADGEIRLIAWEAHLGGYLAGYFLAGLFDRWSFPKLEAPGQAHR